MIIYTVKSENWKKKLKTVKSDLSFYIIIII